MECEISACRLGNLVDFNEDHSWHAMEASKLIYVRSDELYYVDVECISHRLTGAMLVVFKYKYVVGFNESESCHAMQWTLKVAELKIENLCNQSQSCGRQTCDDG